MKQIKWSDGIGSRSRNPFLLFMRGDEVIAFNGQNIPDTVVVCRKEYIKEGKWSRTIYNLQLVDNIHYISGYDGWDTGRFVEGLGSAVGCAIPDTWSDTAKALKVSVPSAMEFLRRWRPQAAEKLDEVEESLARLEEISNNKSDTVIVTVSFGSPSSHEIREGYWGNPKSIPGYKAEIRLKDPDFGWTEENIEVFGISGTVLSVKNSSGMHGGYCAVSVAVIPETKTEILSF